MTVNKGVVTVLSTLNMIISCVCISEYTHTCSLSGGKKKSFKGVSSCRTSLSVRVLQSRNHVPFFGPSLELNIIKLIFSSTGNSPTGGFPSAYQFLKMAWRLDWYWAEATKAALLPSVTWQWDWLQPAPLWFLELCLSCSRTWRWCQQGKCYGAGHKGRCVPLLAPVQQA